MKPARLVLYVAVGFALRSLALLLWGGGGLADYRRVEAVRAQLEANIEELKTINSGLRGEVEALGSDPERIVLAARRLGYFRAGDQVVRFEGSEPRRSLYVLGTLVSVRLPAERPDWIWKLLGLLLPLAAGGVAWLRSKRGRHAAHRL